MNMFHKACKKNQPKEWILIEDLGVSIFLRKLQSQSETFEVQEKSMGQLAAS
jgi:hypothetical protein